MFELNQMIIFDSVKVYFELFFRSFVISTTSPDSFYLPHVKLVNLTLLFSRNIFI